MGAAACGGGAHYAGVKKPALVPPESIAWVGADARGYITLGSVRARCSRPDHAVANAALHTNLADLMCDQALLQEQLATIAARVGGTALGELQCWGQPQSLACKAHVLRAEDDVPGEFVQLARPETSPWDIELTFEPSEAASFRFNAPTHTKSAEEVQLLHYQRPNELGLGQLQVECAECRHEEVVSAIRRAAGGLGARTLVGLSCQRLEGVGERCRGDLAAFEVRAAAF